MKFPHHVVYNGVSYPVGTDVPIEETNGGLNAPVDVSGKDDEEIPVEEIMEEKVVVKDDARKYTDEDLNVPYFSLKAMAKKEGLKIPDKAKASDIKEMLRAL